MAATVLGSGAASEELRKGVAPGAKLRVGKVLDDEGSGYTSDIIAGMEWAGRSGAKVVNMSLGGGATDGTDVSSQALNQISRTTGTLFVVAAGNSGPGSGTVGFPGAADEALTVPAVDREDKMASFSSRGPRVGDGAFKPDIAASGVGTVAARAAGTAMGTVVDEHCTRADGTSMATPHVAGAAALIAQQRPDAAAAGRASSRWPGRPGHRASRPPRHTASRSQRGTEVPDQRPARGGYRRSRRTVVSSGSWPGGGAR
ncbi:hypothetical protein ADL00_09795 [Streptomyces sp. AS58]|nr:hypothetical protein ADL00_09795 [Streptomyces sp. AS58]